MELFASDLEIYVLVSEIYRQIAQVARESIETEFQLAMATSKDFERRYRVESQRNLFPPLCGRMCFLDDHEKPVWLQTPGIV